MSRGPDAGTRLFSAIESHACRHDCAITIVDADWTRWSSATFAGARHDIVLQAEASTRLDAWISGLPDADLSVRGMLVADLSVVGIRRDGATVTILIEALTVEV